MKKERHVYRPPRGRRSGAYAVLGGIVATLLVFIAIPLSQKLADMTTPKVVVMPDPPPPPPPEELTVIEEEPPPEPEEEPPEPPPESAPDLEMALDVGDLSLGTGGGLALSIPKFAIGGGDDPFGGGDLESPPQPYAKSPPVYPNQLLSKGVGGKVLVSCVVDAKGAVVSTKIKESSGNRLLDQAAIKAVKRWKFKPAVRGGKEVKATCVVPFNFEIKR
ncbi:MAG: energy transducer TonB [Verrucomicrobiota bacterium]